MDIGIVPVIFYGIVLACVIIGSVALRVRNKKRALDARKRGQEEAQRIKKREAQRLVNKSKQQTNRYDIYDTEMRQPINIRRPEDK